MTPSFQIMSLMTMVKMMLVLMKSKWVTKIAHKRRVKSICTSKGSKQWRHKMVHLKGKAVTATLTTRPLTMLDSTAQ